MGCWEMRVVESPFLGLGWPQNGYSQDTASAVLARPCSAPTACDSHHSSSMDTGQNSSHTKWSWFALILNLWAGCRFQVDWLHGASVRNSPLWWHFNFSRQGCSCCGCLGAKKPNPSFAREPWAIFRGSATSVLHVHTRNYSSFRPKAITLDITFKNPHRNRAII